MAADAMDIDDILREFDAHTTTSSPSRDLADLTNVWIAERGAPEILPYQEALVDRIMNRVREQIEVVESSTGDLDPTENFRLILLQTELERVKFLVRAYLRCRLAKIDQFAIHYLTTPAMKQRLSQSEIQYSRSHQALLATHYRAAFMRNLPEKLQRLDDNQGGINMVDEPDLDGAVFCRVVKDIDPARATIRIPGTEGEFVLEKGDVYVVRYSAIRDFVVGGGGEVELI